MGGLLFKPKSFYHSRRRMVRCVFVLHLVIDLTSSRCWFDQKVKTESIWPFHVVDLTKRSKQKAFDQFTLLIWPKGQKERAFVDHFGLANSVVSVKPPPPKMGFGGLPKQPRLPPEILAFSSVFQVCFKCVNFFNLTYILILLIIFTFFLLTSHTHISFIDFQ